MAVFFQDQNVNFFFEMEIAMTGQKAFRIVYPILHCIALIFKIFPCWLRNWIWILSNAAPSIIGIGLRYSLAFSSGAKIGRNVMFGTNVTVKNWRGIKIGNNVSIHEGCFIDGLGGIEIGNEVSIAHGTSILSFDHGQHPSLPLKYGELQLSKIVIRDDVWISCGVRILRGSDISSRTIIAANAVVRGPCSGNAIYGGVPAKLLKEIQ